MPSFSATITSKGQLTLPSGLRERWKLRSGDRIEFHQDHLGIWRITPLTAGPLDFAENLPKRSRLPGVASDEDAITRAVLERNPPRRARRAAE
jgi:AbrB family looped-hinge helix DNA binding protein